MQDFLGNQIRALRRAKRMTQETLAEKADLSIQHVGSIERGQGNPTIACVTKLAKALDISVAELFNMCYDSRSEVNNTERQIIYLLKKATSQQLNMIHSVVQSILQH